MLHSEANRNITSAPSVFITLAVMGTSDPLVCPELGKCTHHNGGAVHSPTLVKVLLDEPRNEVGVQSYLAGEELRRSITI